MIWRNLYFASVFCKELDKWKKANKKTQTDFADLTGIHPNSISRYKKGDAFPTPPVLDEICKVFGIDEAAFYPTTPEEKLAFDENYLKEKYSELIDLELEVIKASGINPQFWAFFLSIDNIHDIFPFEIPASDEYSSGMVFGSKNSSGKKVGFTKRDLNFVRYLQNEVETIVSVMAIRELMKKHKSNDETNSSTQ